jgi:hypothetical protein
MVLRLTILQQLRAASLKGRPLRFNLCQQIDYRDTAVGRTDATEKWNML